MATARITDTKVRKLRPRATRYDAHAGIPYLYARVEPTGRKSWYSIFGHGSNRRTKKIGDALAIPTKDAFELHEQNRRAWERGELDQQNPASLTVTKLFEQYWEKAPHKGVKTIAERQRMVTRDVIPALGQREASAVTRGELIQLLEDVKGRGAPVVANRVGEILRACWRWAYRRELVPANVAEELPDMTRELPREVVVKPAELATLWPRLIGQEVEGFRKAMSTQIGTALLLVLFTACRSVEASGARWGELDLDDGWWTIPPARFKSGRTHRVFLHPEIRQRLENLKPEEVKDQDLVFPSPRTGGVLGEKSLHQALTRSTGGRYHVHDIRRSVATAMGDMGVFPYVIERILGHAQPRLQQVYNRSELDQPAKDAWTRWGDHFLNEVQKQQAQSHAEQVCY